MMKRFYFFLARLWWGDELLAKILHATSKEQAMQIARDARRHK